MTVCRYTQVHSLDEAITHLKAADDDTHILAGGVASGVLMNEKLLDPTHLIDISRIASLKELSVDDDGTLRIGSLLTHTEILDSRLVAESSPLLTEMCAEIACGRIRNRGTIGGNICLADPQGDPPVALLALRANLRVAGPDGYRDIPVHEFFEDVYTTALTSDEILMEIRVSPTLANAGYAYGKYGSRGAMDYASTISVAVNLVRDPLSHLITDIGLGLGGVGITPLRPMATESALIGQRPGPDIFAMIKKTLSAELEPIGDNLYSEDYKRHVAWVQLKRALSRAYERAG
ncbi:MAG: hypothetical protein GY794_13595 [bacterium]|nr:hypothetical protein [bacterium]